MNLVFSCAALIIGASPVLSGQGTSDRITASERQVVIDSLAAELRRYYVRPAVAESLIASIDRQEKGGRLSDIETRTAFAERLSALIHTAVPTDAHLTIRLEPNDPRPAVDAPLSPAERAARQRARVAAFDRDARDESYGFPEVRTLDGNIGYVRLGEFLYQTEANGRPYAAPVVNAAMILSSARDALIIDLRANRGGHTSVPSLLLSYLFDARTLLGTTRTRDASTTVEGWTSDPPPTRFGGQKPLFVLTSDSTFSAGESIASALQAHGRARIVGERTRGGGNSGDFHPIGAGLVAFISDAEGVDPKGRSWERVGVTPDTLVPAARALDVAYSLALEALAEREADPERRTKLKTLRAGVVRPK